MVYKAALLVAAVAAAVAALATFGRDAAVMTAAVAPLVQLLKPASHAASALINRTVAPPRERWVQQLSWEPRAYMHHGFLSDAEAAMIRAAAAPHMKPSMIVSHAKAQGSVVDASRASHSMLIRRDDLLIANVLQRVAEWAKLPLSHFEDMQVLQYGAGQQVRPHQHSTGEEVQQDHGPLLCTVLLYLNDVPKGGENVINADVNKRANPEVGAQVDVQPLKCAKGKVVFKPKKGDAFMLWSLKPDGASLDPSAQQTDCPPTKGVEWAASLSIHSRPFRPDTADAPKNPAESDSEYVMM